jgi:drug/metabolite transporter (DMT)-like permease
MAPDAIGPPARGEARLIGGRDLALVLLVVLAWGSNFAAMKIALEELPPLLFVGLRFAILLPLIVLFPRPAPWLAILAIGTFINSGQFAFLFSAMEADVTAGLASLILQSQAPITIVLAAHILRRTGAPAAGRGHRARLRGAGACSALRAGAM